ncbi:DUF6290 family protein [Aerococcaceae bacterium NML190073]|nr:DUF6290 family protein [Aerococcaceae bacterium NML190073]MCW6676763.1 DUF6290 family protein [Aerococcaceae bacterium NML180378]MCW6680343.1 DUF6290 family protein [Aerococcaceae bacterium NML130460]
MATVTIRLNEKEEALFRGYADLTGRKLSELFKSALSERIEDIIDYETGIRALEAFEKNPVTHSIDDFIKELENDL